MMTNLFSIFDPTTNIFNLSINWISSILGMLLIPYYFWIMPNRYNMFFNNILNKLNSEFKILIGFNNTNGTTLIFISLFVFILFNNVMGIFSYIFTSTSHLITSFTITLPLWLSFMLYGWINHSEHMFSHLIPQGTPTVLMPFMVIIETISNLIRPGTLAVRLTANMIAGHLLLTLLSNNGTVIGTKFISFLILIQIMLLTLETAVAIIQSYVISILSTLYSKEVY